MTIKADCVHTTQSNNENLWFSVQERENILLQNGLCSAQIWNMTLQKDMYIKKQCKPWSIQDNALTKGLHLAPSSPFSKNRLVKAHKKRVEILGKVSSDKDLWPVKRKNAIFP
jgi:hypothetical protein